MNVHVGENDISHVVEADKAHVWHHLTQHKKFDTTDPMIIVEGKGMRVWNQAGREHLDAVSGGVAGFILTFILEATVLAEARGALPFRSTGRVTGDQL